MERGDGRKRSTGGCLCGGVRYEVDGPLRPVVNCHCSQCRRTSGHYVAATAAWKDDLRVVEAGSLRWYESSTEARRGFCGNCGSNLFWEAHGGRGISIMAGTLDGPTGLGTGANIFIGDAGDYYEMPAAPEDHRDGAHGLFPDS